MRGILALLLVVAIGGCQYLSPIGPIVDLAMKWVEGEAHKYYNCDQDTLVKAVKEALDELKFAINEESEDEDTFLIKTGENDKFKIKIIAVRDNVTKLSIRVNTMGNKPYAELIYRHVDKNPAVGQFASLKQLNTAMKQRKRPIVGNNR